MHCLPGPGSRLFVLVKRRGEILVVRREDGVHALPGDTLREGESVREAIARIAAALAGSDATAVGDAIVLGEVRDSAFCFPILTKRSAFENWAATEKGLVWLGLAECRDHPERCGEELRMLLESMPEDAGNGYALGATNEGIPTFFHLATGEALHGQVGPWEEAQQLYLPLSRLRTRSGRVVVHDLGLGCGTLALAAFEAFMANPQLEDLLVISYDLEKKGIDLLLAHLDHFPFAQPFQRMVEQLQTDDVAHLRTTDGRVATWRFVGGDYAATARQPLMPAEAANVVFLDFFSPKSLPELWTYAVMRAIYENSASDVVVITSSSATSVRAALAAAGFFVGFAPESGKRARSTVAARRMVDLEAPLPTGWLRTFLASHVQFSAAEPPESQQLIRESVVSHPQFVERA